jgi:hypothetical protein
MLYFCQKKYNLVHSIDRIKKASSNPEAIPTGNQKNTQSKKYE